MIVLGINEGHNASCSIAIDGKIVAAAQEERFTRIKNQSGLPLASIKFCLNFANIKPQDINLVAFAGGIPAFLTSLKTSGSAYSPSAFRLLKYGKDAHLRLRKLILDTEYRLPFLRGIDKTTIEPYYKLTQKIFFPKTIQLLTNNFGINPKNHIYVNHHIAHAFTALFASPFPSQKLDALIVTCDGGGDGLSATISTYKKGELKIIASSTQDNSLGCLYGIITDILGMKPLEHEYKVMGLAPYAEDKGTQVIYQFLKSTIKLNTKNLSWQTIVSSDNLNRYVREHIPTYRFDHLAGAIQKLTEELLCTWIEAAIKRTRLENIVYGGGVAQNVKANQKIAALPEIKKFFIMPSAGDESNCIGCAYWGTQKLNSKISLKPINNLYLGPSYSQSQIKNALIQAKSNKFKIHKLKDSSRTAAELLAKGKIIARFSGRMEFGARALGNRSILADPANFSTIGAINYQIKSRDFWMPFAPTILDTDSSKYLVNPKKLKSPFMTLTYNTQAKYQKDLIAAIHPQDQTTRPQILEKEASPAYYELIQNFKKITGRGAILNTSFNIHGQPLVCSPQDAISTLQKTGLKLLLLENNLIEKII